MAYLSSRKLLISSQDVKLGSIMTSNHTDSSVNPSRPPLVFADLVTISGSH